jgi:hypothetical protein
MTKLPLNVLFCFLLTATSVHAVAQSHELANGTIVASFGPSGLMSILDGTPGSKARTLEDSWSIAIDNVLLQSSDSKPSIHASSGQIAYEFKDKGYELEVVYRVAPGWGFVSKQIRVLRAPYPQYTVHRVTPIMVELADDIKDVRIPTSYTPQMGQTIEETHKTLPGRDFGLFLRLSEKAGEGLMLLVQNPFLQVAHALRTASLQYEPEMQWRQEWGPFTGDSACIGPYHLTGTSLPREMLLEWKIANAEQSSTGLDRGEVKAFTDCVHAFLLHPSPSPTSVEVGWTLNDYQIDVATNAGKAEYKRIIDTTAQLGIKTLLYAPTNSHLAARNDDADSWHWEHTLWLNLGQKIRKGEWDPVSSPIPSEVTEMVSYAKSKKVGLLAYVYPSVPFQQNASWLVKGNSKNESATMFASMSSRGLQDLLIRDLVAFKRRTGIAGYSFDYAFLNFNGSSSYAQWSGWRRVMEELRRAEPDIIIDGRQSYQQYGPWSWLAGSYPHPTGQDEQPESFLPYPDLHFDRVSANRLRYVNYWYRNYQFAPSEVVPGYATHQTERSRNVPDDEITGGHPQKVEEVHTAYRLRDWDYLGYRYSFLSSIGTAGWNNVVDMIPARDSEEFKHFSDADKNWIRTWLQWTETHKELLRHTQTILHQPQIGKLDGTSAIQGNRGFLFLYNPNYKSLHDEIVLNKSIGLDGGSSFILREVYPRNGYVWGKTNAGFWAYGDRVPLHLDGTSATVLEIMPATEISAGTVFNADALPGKQPAYTVAGEALEMTGAAGEPGTESVLGLMLPHGKTLRSVKVNGQAIPFDQHGKYLSTTVRFAGTRFAQAQQVDLQPVQDGSMTGTFTVPGRVFEQLKARAKAWPIPWTDEDYKTTWLAPERLLLFIQAAEAQDTMSVDAMLDGQPLIFKRAYTSTRVHPGAFVGLYADLSMIAPDKPHKLRLKLSGIDAKKFQGVFFDNVVPELTTQLSVER